MMHELSLFSTLFFVQLSVILTLFAVFMLFDGTPMAIGTKSCLYGYHAVWLHWFFVARGWWTLYRFRRVPIGANHTTRTTLYDPRLWLAFIIHDLGYVGKPNMDGIEGEQHPMWAACWMGRVFGQPFGDLCLYHSRFYAKRHSRSPSALCYADKLAITYYPEWLMVRLVRLTGEAREYMKDAQRQNPGIDTSYWPQNDDVLKWFRGVKVYVTQWVAEHKDGRADMWTAPSVRGSRETIGPDGVWR